MTWNTCYKCKCQMWIPDALNEAALRGRGTGSDLSGRELDLELEEAARVLNERKTP